MPGKLTPVALIFFLSTLVSSAQKNLKESIVVLNSTDTVKGYIDYKEWLTSPSIILFTTDKSQSLTRYTPTELSYFEVLGMERYQRYTVKISLSNDALSTIGEKDTSTETKTVFLKILEKGKNLTLLSYRDKLKQRLYILDKGEATPAELLNSAYILNGQVMEEKQYRSGLNGLLYKYLPGDNDLISKVNTMGYYADDIADICRKINGNTTTVVYNVTASDNKPALRVYIGAGINHGALKMVGDNLFSGINSNPFYFPVADIGADLLLKRSVGRLGIRGDLHITGYKTDAYVFKDFAQYTEEYFFTFRQQNIAFSPQLLYNLYNQKKLKWFVTGGVGINFASYSKNQMYFIRKSSTNSDATDNNYLKTLKSVWVNLCFSTGIEIHRMSAAVYYYPPASVTQTQSFGLDNSSLQLRLGYYIKK